MILWKDESFDITPTFVSTVLSIQEGPSDRRFERYTPEVQCSVAVSEASQSRETKKSSSLQNAPEQLPAAKLHQYMASLPASIHQGLLLPNLLTPGLCIRPLGEACIISASFFFLHHLIYKLHSGDDKKKNFKIRVFWTTKGNGLNLLKISSLHSHCCQPIVTL